MIVLLHAYNKGFTAWEVAIMFTLYELAGVFTNLLAGFMGSKWGIKTTLLTGLSFQILSYGMMFGWDDSWGKKKAIIYVTIAQMFAGIAKDLTKLGGKTVTKLVTPEEQQTNLFRLVSFITGFKNSMKGVGYFVGSALLNVSYRLSLGVMMILIGLAFPWAILGLNRNLGTAKKKSAKSWKEVWAFDNRNLNYLSLARLFLFASRDFWFEVPLPFYLRSPGCGGLGIDFSCNVNKDCTYGAICDLSKNLSGTGICINGSLGGGCGGLGKEVVGLFTE
jgi:MFS family permease